MNRKVITKKPYLIEGKLIKAGSRIIVENATDMETYNAPATSSKASMPNSTDIETLRRIRRAKALRHAKGVKDVRAMRRITLNDADGTFPADEIQVARKARATRRACNPRTARAMDDENMDVETMRRLAKLRQIRRAKKAEEETPTDDKVEERRKAIRRARMMRHAEKPTEDDAKVEERRRALRKARLARVKKSEVDNIDETDTEDKKMEEMLNK